MHARRIGSNRSKRPHTERKGFRRTVVSTCSAAGLLITGVLLSGCTHTREYIQNGFKVGPNYEMPPAAVAQQQPPGFCNR